MTITRGAGRLIAERPVPGSAGTHGGQSLWQGAGFTVVELVVIVAIIGIMLLYAALNFADWRNNATLRKTARDVVCQMQFARMEAARRNTSILIQVNTGGPGSGNCIIFIDDGSGGGTAGNQSPEPGEILRQLTMPQGVTLSATTAPIVQYSNRGFPVVGGGSTVTLTNGEKTYNVAVAAAGSVRLNGPV
ncbi:MAG: GspH/FimT family pseudopilin [Deltaproteobacteria bacterium]|nr:GspH/FimT family pseudopilin [Deltaproteobacteria bacterium]MBW2072783.1 GspH/FimT family pseudopilin [Deltaproteobacteria bacterium]